MGAGTRGPAPAGGGGCAGAGAVSWVVDAAARPGRVSWGFGAGSPQFFHLRLRNPRPLWLDGLGREPSPRSFLGPWGPQVVAEGLVRVAEPAGCRGGSGRSRGGGTGEGPPHLDLGARRPSDLPAALPRSGSRRIFSSGIWHVFVRDQRKRVLPRASGSVV